MKNITIGIACLICICGKTLFATAEEGQGFNSSSMVCARYMYLELGTDIFFLPYVAVGIRDQKHHNGFNASLGISYMVLMYYFKGSLLYHYYPKPSLNSQYYLGAGMSYRKETASILPEKSASLSPEFVIGRDFLTARGGKRFFQIQASWPVFYFEGSKFQTIPVPLVAFTYGIGF